MRLLCLLSLALFISNATSQDQSRKLKPVVVWSGSDSHQLTTLFARCDTWKELRAVWSKHQARDENQFLRPLPDVDFEKYMAVAIFAGEGRGPWLSVDEVYDERDVLRIRFYEGSSQSLIILDATSKDPQKHKESTNTDKTKLSGALTRYGTYAFVIIPRSEKVILLEEGKWPHGRMDEPMVWKECAKLAIKKK